MSPHVLELLGSKPSDAEATELAATSTDNQHLNHASQLPTEQELGQSSSKLQLADFNLIKTLGTGILHYAPLHERIRR